MAGGVLIGIRGHPRRAGQDTRRRAGWPRPDRAAGRPGFRESPRPPPMPFHPQLLDAAREAVREVEGHDVELPSELPVLPLKDTVVFPDSVLPLAIGQERSIKLVDEVVSGDRLLALVAVRSYVRRPETPAFSATVLTTFSRQAAVAVGLLVLGGVLLEVILVGSVYALLTQPYGWTVIAKSLLLLPMLVLAWANHRRVPRIARGELRLQAFAVTEPDAGNDITHIKTFARREGDYYVINGRKVFTTKARESKKMLVLTRTTPFEKVTKKTDGMTLFFADIDPSAVEVRELPADLAALDAKIEADPAKYEAVIAENQKAHHDSGHWGVPTMVFQGEPFFGQDRLDVLLWRLEQKRREQKKASRAGAISSLPPKKLSKTATPLPPPPHQPRRAGGGGRRAVG